MRRVMLASMALAMLLVAFAGAARGASARDAAGSRPASGASGGEVFFMGSSGCDLTFEFRGFARGTTALVQVTSRGHVSTFRYRLTSTDAMRTIGLHPLLMDNKDPVQVAFRATAQGAVTSASGTAVLDCRCEGMGEGGGGGGSGGGSGSGSGEAAEAGPATPIVAQPSFTG